MKLSTLSAVAACLALLLGRAAAQVPSQPSQTATPGCIRDHEKLAVQQRSCRFTRGKDADDAEKQLRNARQTYAARSRLEAEAANTEETLKGCGRFSLSGPCSDKRQLERKLLQTREELDRIQRAVEHLHEPTVQEAADRLAAIQDAVARCDADTVAENDQECAEEDRRAATREQQRKEAEVAAVKRAEEQRRADEREQAQQDARLQAEREKKAAVTRQKEAERRARMEAAGVRPDQVQNGRFFIVARLAPDTYEVALEGPCSGFSGSCPSKQHAILISRVRSYKSEGWIRISIVYEGQRNVQTKNGFDQSLPVMREVDF